MISLPSEFDQVLTCSVRIRIFHSASVPDTAIDKIPIQPYACQRDKRNRRYNDQCNFQRSSHFCPLLSNGSVHSWQKLRRACALIPPTCPAIIMPMGLPPRGYGCR